MLICQFIKLLFLLNNLILINSKINYLVRVDNIAPTCLQRPICKQYSNLDGAVINVDKSLPFMGSSQCCIEFLNDNEAHDGFIIKVLRPTYFIGTDSLSIYENSTINGTLVDEIASNDTNLYREIFINSSLFTIEFNKDKNSKSIFEILIVSLKRNVFLNNGYNCLEFYCNKSNLCISKDLVCDRYPHCSLNEDEWFNCDDDLNNINDELIWNELRPKIMLMFSLMLAFIFILLISFTLIHIIESRNCWLCYKSSNSKNGQCNNRRKKLNSIY